VTLAGLGAARWGKARVIDLLRRELGGTWTYVRAEHVWRSSTGVEVFSEAHDAARTDTEERYRTVYRRSDTREEVLVGRGRYWTPDPPLRTTPRA
jgi:hypothetical protein